MVTICVKGGGNTIGYKHGEASKNKIRYKALSRKCLTGSESPFYGKKLSLETRLKISNSLSGEKNPMYNKTFYDIWVKKFGKEEADKRLVQYRENIKLRQNKTKGIKFSDERKVKLKASLQNRNFNGINNPFYGKTHSLEQKLKWSNDRKGRKIEGEWLENIRISRKKNCKKVINIYTGEIFNSIGEAQERYGLKNGIANVCRGKKKTAAGYRWEFYNNLNCHDDTVPSLRSDSFEGVTTTTNDL